MLKTIAVPLIAASEGPQIGHSCLQEPTFGNALIDA